ncbi:hypothetical protein [Jeotgalibacillus salarius]|uniref:hypothetical protein n=1 Tax=Jeotgalibacillus salarius TaxID=546023 RepID=UPI00141ABD74|nr:hypothetical protein [Jeotgalibacillus salarius]
MREGDYIFYNGTAWTVMKIDRRYFCRLKREEGSPMIELVHLRDIKKDQNKRGIN